MKSVLFLALIIFVIGVNAQSKMDDDNVTKGVDQFVRVFNEGGMSGAAGEVESCYEQASKLKPKSNKKYAKFEYCLSMDLAAFKWESHSLEMFKFPRSKFFELEAISSRVAGLNEFGLGDWNDRLIEVRDSVNQYIFISFQIVNEEQIPPSKIKKSAKIKTQTPASSIDLESKAKDFVRDLFSSFSSDSESAMNFLKSNIKKDVMFYGKKTNKEIILKEKEKFIKRWPNRNYVERPESLKIKCENIQNTCLVEGVIDWDARNSNKISIGVAKFIYELHFINGSPQIASESSEVIERK